MLRPGAVGRLILAGALTLAFLPTGTALGQDSNEKRDYDDLPEVVPRLPGRQTRAEGTGTIAGVIVETDEGSPLGHANITVAGTRLGAMSDEKGHFTIKSVPPGTYRLIASCMGYGRQEVDSVVVHPDSTTRYRFEFVPQLVGTFACGFSGCTHTVRRGKFVISRSSPKTRDKILEVREEMSVFEFDVLGFALNPRDSTYAISFSVPYPNRVKVCVFDFKGKRIVTLADTWLLGGLNTIEWNRKDSAGNAVGPGKYYCRVEFEHDMDSKEILIPTPSDTLSRDGKTTD